MRKYAIIENNVVSKVVDAEESDLVQYSNNTVIDIEDQIPQPEAGWVLEGNVLSPVSSNLSDDERRFRQQTAQRQFGQKLSIIATDLVGSRNLKLHEEGTPVDIATLGTQMQSLKVLLEGGALKTVRTLCGMLAPAFPNHSDILQIVSAEITNFLNNKGYN